MENHWWNVKSSLKNKSWGHFLEEIFQPGDSKSLRMRITPFEAQLNFDVWGSPSGCLCWNSF